MVAIPASRIVSVVPAVLSAGGTSLALNGLILTNSTRIPIGTVQPFVSSAAVAELFGPTSTEAALATTYFGGYTNSSLKPASLLMAQYNQSNVRAYLRGGSLGMTLTELQALTGVLSVTIDGVLQTSSSINLSSATSFSRAAELITVGLAVTGPQTAAFTGSISTTTLTVSAVSSGTLNVGDEVRGGTVAAGTQITAFGTGTGGTGTYTISTSQTVASTSLTTNTPVVTYDVVTDSFLVISPTTGASSTIAAATGTLAAPVKLSAATGAVTSQGAAAASPTGAMAVFAAQSQNWATFTTSFNPDVSGNANKVLFAQWANGSSNRFLYVGWDADAAPTSSPNASSSFGRLIKDNEYSGAMAIYSPSDGANKAAFVMGSVASLDFSRLNGRATLAFRGQSGLSADVVDETIASNLLQNGYNYVGRYATDNDEFTFLYNGQISGPFLWADSFVTQIWLNSQFQLALMVLLTSVGSIPYNTEGYNQIRAALLDPIQQGANFGAFRPGVTLSQSQISQVNSQAGRRIDDVLSQNGWFLLVQDASPQVRQARGSPPITFWYVDGQSVQMINLSSVNVQ